MKIELKPINKENWFECTQLKVDEEQKSFVASNTFSLAQAGFQEKTYPVAIYSNESMVGFLMYDYDTERDCWEMCRLMIDKKFQNKGYGREALINLIELVRNEHGHVKFFTSYELENEIASKLFESVGFVRTGNMFEGEELVSMIL